MDKLDANRYLQDFKNLLNSYLNDYPDYIPATVNKLYSEFKNYCHFLNKVDKQVANDIINLGKKYAREKKVKGKADGSSWISYFLLAYQKRPTELIPIENVELRNTFFKNICGDQSVKFTSKMGGPVSAYNRWWNLQESKHTFAQNYLEGKNEIVAPSDGIKEIKKTNSNDLQIKHAGKEENGLSPKKRFNLKVENLTKKYLSNPNCHRTKEEVSFVIDYRNRHREFDNKEALIRNIQGDPVCPTSLTEKSDKIKKRIRRIIVFYDKETLNKRKKNDSSRLT